MYCYVLTLYPVVTKVKLLQTDTVGQWRDGSQLVVSQIQNLFINITDSDQTKIMDSLPKWLKSFKLPGICDMLLLVRSKLARLAMEEISGGILSIERRFSKMK